jgi:hypothetical protein
VCIARPCSELFVLKVVRGAEPRARGHQAEEEGPDAKRPQLGEEDDEDEQADDDEADDEAEEEDNEAEVDSDVVDAGTPQQQEQQQQQQQQQQEQEQQQDAPWQPQEVPAGTLRQLLHQWVVLPIM